MLQNSLRKLLTANWHFVAIVLFFILRGYHVHGDLIPVWPLLFLLGKLLVAGAILFGLGYKIFRSAIKAGLFTSTLLIIVLFYGVVHDFLEHSSWKNKLSHHSLLMGLAMAMAILVFILLKRTNRPLHKPVLFINVLLLIYLLFEAGAILLGKAGNQRPLMLTNKPLKTCDTCRHPDVYLLILDEYMGDSALLKYYNYDNAFLRHSLAEEGFHIVQKPQSNYSVTMFSMASMLNMDYLPLRKPVDMADLSAYQYSLRVIRDNEVCHRFQDLGYRIVNYSPFNLRDLKAGYDTELIPDGIGLLTSQTIWFRIGQYLPAWLMKKGIGTSMATKMDDRFANGNQSMMDLALSGSQTNTSTPSFYYVHLSMPHEPYLFDSLGKRMPSYLTQSEVPQEQLDHDYLQYLVYVNKKIVTFLQQLQHNTDRKAVILLMSDHGNRYVRKDSQKMMYQNLNAVYLPSGNYQGFYDGITNVNQFRVLFNTLYKQEFSILKDSLVN